MCSLEKRIRDLIHFYVKENYNHHLQKNELTFIKEEDFDPEVISQAEIQIKYSAYIEKELKNLQKEEKSSFNQIEENLHKFGRKLEENLEILGKKPEQSHRSPHPEDSNDVVEVDRRLH